MELFERLSGARMHTALYKPFNLTNTINYNYIIRDVLFIVNRGSRFICGSFMSLLNNRSLKTRLSGVGKLSTSKLNSYGITGVIARSSGIALDFRVTNENNYSKIYNNLNIISFIGSKGDCFDRFVVRSKEIIESFRLVLQVCSVISLQLVNNSSLSRFKSMEGVIESFKVNSSWLSYSNGLFSSTVEGPKGLIKCNIVISCNYLPYRLQVRSPVAHNMNLISSLSNGVNFADFVATFCSIDVVLGEIDR